MKKTTASAETGALSLELAGEQQLTVQSDQGVSILRILDPGGRVTLRVEVSENGPVLCFESGLQVRASGALDFEGQRVAIRGREGVRIESGADTQLVAAGDLHSDARVQNIRARLGNVNLKANDDVKLRAERIRLNC
jgi:hypothetical protein